MSFIDFLDFVKIRHYFKSDGNRIAPLDTNQTFLYTATDDWYYAALLTAKTYGKQSEMNSICRYYSANKTLALHPMDFDPYSDPILDDFLLSEQIEIANCIVACCAALEETGLLFSNLGRRNSLLNANKTRWNDKVYKKTEEHLRALGIDPCIRLPCLSRGKHRCVSGTDSINSLKLCEWSGENINDFYISPTDALLEIKHLRNKVGAHSAGDLILNLSFYDAENVLTLCRMLLLMKFELYEQIIDSLGA
ncbi:MAG: hypothetical protein IJZ42_01815 [Lachnospiraceae bacterium]|nr:hypothetical protein [Lachnospiraceae bacterium]